MFAPECQSNPNLRKLVMSQMAVADFWSISGAINYFDVNTVYSILSIDVLSFSINRNGICLIYVVLILVCQTPKCVAR
jgi:hypothetical protein